MRCNEDGESQSRREREHFIDVLVRVRFCVRTHTSGDEIVGEEEKENPSVGYSV